MSTHVAHTQTEGEYLADLRRYFGEPDDDQLLGLEHAARLLRASRLTWSQLTQAIDDGWEPRDETVVDFLYAVDAGS